MMTMVKMMVNDDNATTKSGGGVDGVDGVHVLMALMMLIMLMLW